MPLAQFVRQHFATIVEVCTAHRLVRQGFTSETRHTI